MSASHSNIRTSLTSPGVSGRGSYSAHVELHLILPDGRRLPLDQIGPDKANLTDPARLENGPAVVEMKVDDAVRTWNVQLAPGDESSRIVPFAAPLA